MEDGGERRRRHLRRRRRRCLMCTRRYIQISVTSYKMHLDSLNHLEEPLKQVFLQSGGRRGMGEGEGLLQPETLHLREKRRNLANLR